VLLARFRTVRTTLLTRLGARLLGPLLLSHPGLALLSPIRSCILPPFTTRIDSVVSSIAPDLTAALLLGLYLISTPILARFIPTFLPRFNSIFAAAFFAHLASIFSAVLAHLTPVPSYVASDRFPNDPATPGPNRTFKVAALVNDNAGHNDCTRGRRDDGDLARNVKVGAACESVEALPDDLAPALIAGQDVNDRTRRQYTNYAIAGAGSYPHIEVGFNPGWNCRSHPCRGDQE
jgi:hypothetical protein